MLLGFAAVRLIQRIAALLIGILNLASLRAQHVSLPPEVHLPLLQQLRVVGYVSFLINPGVAAALFAVARRWQITASQAAGQAVAIVVVGLIHRTGMAGVSNPQGLAWRTRLAAGFCAQGCDTG